MGEAGIALAVDSHPDALPIAKGLVSADDRFDCPGFAGSLSKRAAGQQILEDGLFELELGGVVSMLEIAPPAAPVVGAGRSSAPVDR